MFDTQTTMKLGNGLYEKRDLQSHASEIENAAPCPNPQEIESLQIDKKRIRRLIDLRLILPTGILYCTCVLDRTNLSLAAIAGMRADLDLGKGFRYSAIALIFFVSYIIFQPPATVICRKIGPRPFLTVLTFLWGIIMMGFGFSQHWTVLLGLRFVLGIFEAGFFPGCVYLISTWYTRYEVQKRYAVFYLLGMFANAFGGLLAFGLMQMDGAAGYAGWRWIFIIEGVLTSTAAIICYVFLVDFPDKAYKTSWRFLTQEECQSVITEIENDRADTTVESWNWKNWLSSALDFKIWVFGLLFCCTTGVNYALTFFLPLILRDGMGYSIGMSQCLVTPPYVLTAFVMYVTSWVADRYHVRGPIILANCAIGIVGLCLMGFTSNNGVRYFGVFLVASFGNSNIPAVMAYQANNIRGQWKRAFGSATLISMGGIGGIFGATVFRSQDAPWYFPGMYGAIACNAAMILIVACLILHFRSKNQMADRYGVVLEGHEAFRYTI